MALVKFTRSGTGAGVFRAAVDGVALKYDGDKAEKELAPGEHAFTWYFRATPGTKYSVAITEPKPNAWTHSPVIDDSQLDANVHWFLVGGEQ